MALYHPEPTFNQFERERFERLKELFPDAFTDGEVNWEAIYKIFEAEDSDDEERYGLNFPGKRAARQLTYEPPTGAIHPETESELEKTTGNVFIEGDNLEVLKHLRKAYAGRVKMIYIDPPYNTENDLVYIDDFSIDKKSYELNSILRKKSKDGKNGKLTTNQRTNGRFHSKWLSMMYPRLRVARDLLTEDGVIFISIDDREQAVLKLLMDELFGEENFISILKRRASRKDTFLRKVMSDVCDYVLIYSKTELVNSLSYENVADNTRPVFNNGNSISQRIIRENTEARCQDGFYEKGNYKVKTMEFELLDDLIIENKIVKNEVRIKGQWRINQQILDKTIYITSNFGFRRYLLEEELEKTKSINDLVDNPKFYNELGSESLNNIFQKNNIFDNPKPPKLIDFLISVISNSKNNNTDLIIDFFAGSGTTGQAVMEMNAEDGGNRQFILVQIDEEIKKEKIAFKEGYKFISEITKERLRRAAKKIREEKGEEATKEVDLDFRSFRVEPSHFRAWDEVNYDETMSRRRNLETLDLQLDEYLHTSIDPEFDKLNLTHFWGLVTEMALSEGFPLDSEFKIDSETYTKNTVLVVHHPKSQSELMVLHICFDEKIHPETVAQLAKEGYATFICHDSAIDDESKVRLSDQCKCLIRTF